MKKLKNITAEGFQDTLFPESYKKRFVEESIRKIFRAFGYFEVETPTFEYYDTFNEGLVSTEAMFKFFDQNGKILVLRPDLTVPTARIAASKMKDYAFPLKISYAQKVFRFNETGGKQKELDQAGIEFIGLKKPEVDAEVLSIAIQAIIESGIREFQIDIGQVEFFKGIVEEAELDAAGIEELRGFIDKKDILGVDLFVERQGIKKDLGDILSNLSSLYGNIEIIKKARNLTKNKRALEALEYIENVFNILYQRGYEKYVAVDLGMVRRLNYYTGIIFRGYTYGVGYPILSGGRYDNLVGNFGKNSPAVGFSINLNELLAALSRQKINIEIPKISVLIGFEDGEGKNAYELASKFRLMGMIVEEDFTNKNLEKLKEYANKKEISKLLLISSSNNSENVAGVARVQFLDTNTAEEFDMELGEFYSLMEESKWTI